MLARFDPVERRNSWLQHRLAFATSFEPDTVAIKARPGYVHLTMNSMIDAYLVGLANDVRPTLETIIAWMENQPEPDRLVFSSDGDNWDAWWSALYEWRQTLGLCKWLSRGDPANREFAGALQAEWDALEQAGPKHVASARAELREVLSARLATALAGNVPQLGLKIYGAAGVKRPSGYSAPLLRFGQWACSHLAEGGTRDGSFVARGKDMLTASLLPKFFWQGDRIEPGLWLKAIYFDSGVVRTPEQAIARAYDSMPGVERPDFVAG
jgi:hypothetical protein